MISRRQYFSIVLIMVAVFLLFQGTQLGREHWGREQQLNGNAGETHLRSDAVWSAPEPAADGTDAAQPDGGRQGLAARSAALVKGGILLVEENTPFGTPRDNEGTPLDPALSVPARNHCTRCAKNCLRFPVAAFDLVCVFVRSAAAAAGLWRCAALRRSCGGVSKTFYSVAFG